MAEKRKDSKGRVLKEGESQRKDGSYMYRYTDAFKKRKYVYAQTLTELREKVKKVNACQFFNIDAGEKSGLTVLDLVDRYCEMSQGKRLSTQEQYKYKRNVIAKQRIAQIDAKMLKPSECKRWMIGMLNEGYASGSIYGYAQLIKWSYNVAIQDELLLKNPFGFKFNFLPKPKTRIPLTKKEQETFLEFLSEEKQNDVYFDMCTILLGTGMRVSEYAGLTIKDIDLEKKTISITKQLKMTDGGKLYVEGPKSQNGNRIIPMSDDVEESVKRMVERADKNKRFNIKVDGHENFIMRSKQGKVINPSAYTPIFQRLNKQYNEKYDADVIITPHVLRHTFCTNMAAAGMSVSSLQYLMGHAQASVTLNVYTHNSFDQAYKEFTQNRC